MEQEVVETNNTQEKITESATDRINSMRKRADLSDIILEKEKNVVNKKKKVILSAAVLVLVFLVFLIISKLINASGEQNNGSTQNKIVLNEDNNKKVEPSKEATIVVSDKSDKKLSETDLKFEEMVKKLKEEDAKENGSIVETPEIKKVQESVKEREKIKIATPTIKKVETPKKTTNTNIIKEKITIESNKIEKVIKTKKPITKKPIFSNKSGYFIQVAATTTPTPKKTLISRIRRSGFSYTTHPVYVKGKKFYKILIGPYKSRGEALRKIDIIKSNINPKAYIIHLR